MTRLAANLTFLFSEVPFLDRFAAAAACGFRGVEFLFPYDRPAEETARAAADAGVAVALFNLPPGDWDAGERGLAALPGREGEFREAVERALDHARVIGAPTLHALAGVLPADADLAEAERVYVDNLRRACDRLAAHGLTLTIEPINTVDMPGYFLCSAAQADRVIDRVGRDNLRLQLDLYHAQVMRGDLSGQIARHFDRIAHVQIAGHPGRHEPDVGEIHYPHLLGLLNSLGYHGWVGCEYRPRAGAREGLGWAVDHGILPETQAFPPVSPGHASV